MSVNRKAILKNKWFVTGLLCFVVISTILLVWFRSLNQDPCKTVFSSEYDRLVIRDNPVLYLPLSDVSGTCEDSFQRSSASQTGVTEITTLPNGDNAFIFNGRDSSITVEDNDAFSVSTTGQLTMEAWMRPDTLQFEHEEGSGYVYWMGKGELDSQEYVARMYSYSNAENRPNRISGYAFNPVGGLGVGSYFEDPIAKSEWIYYVLVINVTSTNEMFPIGYTKIYKNGVLQDQDDLSELNIVPENGTAPFRIGTRDFNSFFEGAIGKVALYDYELTESQIFDHYQEMVR